APAKPGTTTATRLKGPIKITAERAELERREYALYRGSVRLESSDMVMTGDRLELRQPGRGEFEARLTGAPARLDHPGNEKNPALTASAAQIVYDTRTATVDLSGGVQLARGTDMLSSGNVRYNVAARRISANGDGTRQVQITITPPHNEAPAPKPKPEPKKPS
ncbi:MAG: LptA/OstA family protein, partial [Gammaproteobacteria bacterium]